MEMGASLQNTSSELQLDVPHNNYRTERRALVKRYGMPLGILKSIEAFNGKIERVIDSPGTQEVLNKDPVLLIMTHNYGYEVVSAIGGLPENSGVKEFREVKLVSEAPLKPNWLSKYILPLYNVSKEEPQGLARKINRKINPPMEIDQVKAVGLNAATLRDAGERIGKGELILICPEGTREKDGRWQNGVAAVLKIAKRTLSKENREGYVVMTSVEGFSIKNFIIDKISNYFPKLSPFRNIKVRYSEPVPISTISTDVSGDEIVKNLEDRYNDWLMHRNSKM